MFSTGDESFVILRGQSSIGLQERVVRQMSIVGEDIVCPNEIIRRDITRFDRDITSNRFETLTKMSEIAFDRSELLDETKQHSRTKTNIVIPVERSLRSFATRPSESEEESTSNVDSL